MKEHTMTVYFASWLTEDGDEHTENWPCRYDCTCGTAARYELLIGKKIKEHMMGHVRNGDQVRMQGNWTAENEI